MRKTTELFFGTRNDPAVKRASLDGIAQPVLDFKPPVWQAEHRAVSDKVGATGTPFIMRDSRINSQRCAACTNQPELPRACQIGANDFCNLGPCWIATEVCNSDGVLLRACARNIHAQLRLGSVSTKQRDCHEQTRLDPTGQRAGEPL